MEMNQKYLFVYKINKRRKNHRTIFQINGCVCVGVRIYISIQKYMRMTKRSQRGWERDMNLKTYSMFLSLIFVGLGFSRKVTWFGDTKIMFLKFAEEDV